MSRLPKPQVWFSQDGASAEFRPVLPYRGMGKFLLAVSPLGVVLLVITVWGAMADPPKDPFLIPFFLCFSLCATFGFLLPGLYLATRRRRVTVNAREVVSEKGWALSRSEERHVLSEFAGLRRTSKEVGTADAETVTTTVLGVAAAAVTGSGVVASKMVTMHYLNLTHAGDASRDVVLACSPDGAHITSLMDEMSKRFSLNVVTPTLDGYAVIRPEEVEQSVGERVGPPAASVPSMPDPSMRLTLQRAGDVATVLLPRSRVALVAGLCVGLPMLAIVVVGLVQQVQFHLLIIPLLIGVGLPAIGIVTVRRPCRMILSPQGMNFEAARPNNQSENVFLAWRDVRTVSGAAPARMRKPMLLVSARNGDHWLASPLREGEIRWLTGTILAAARRFGCGGGETPPAS